jgi:Type II CAAX prenyl endopeptidase Rce1-like
MPPILNNLIAVQARMREGRIHWAGPVGMLFARFGLAVVLQTLLAGLFALRGDPTPWRSAAPWWTVYGTLIDLGCLLALAWLTRREGLRLRDLLNWQRAKLAWDIWWCLPLYLLYAALGIGGAFLAGLLLYGATPPNPIGGLPFWAMIYTITVWPWVWGIVEEMTYQGYALPRLEALTGRPWLAVLLTGLAWAFQHVALPLMWDWRFMLYRFAATLPFMVILPIYRRVRRLFPFMVAHGGLDAFAAVLASAKLG